MTGRLAGALIALLSCLVTNGCVLFIPDKIHYDWDAQGIAPPPDHSSDEDGEFVGLAFSGGGSRAALFAAAGAEALNDAGWLERVTHISSVSGGGFAASYLVSHPVPACGGENGGGCAADYFATFKAMMREDYILPMEWRQIYHPGRFLSPTRRIVSLEEVLNKKFLNDRTFGQLPSDKTLLINAASYDDSRRFVFSNRPVPPWPATAAARANALETAPKTLWASGFAVDGVSYKTPDDFPLALAVASSAAFPPLLGPVSIQVADDDDPEAYHYWHLGDGGILDNSGVETLEELIARKAVAGEAPARAVIFAFNASVPVTPEASMDKSSLRLWTTNPGQVVTIANERAEALRAVVWRQVEDQLGVPVAVVEFRLVDADIGPWPAACKPSARSAATPEEAIRKVPTSLRISKCNAALVEAAARQVVEDAFPEVKKALADLGFKAAD